MKEKMEKNEKKLVASAKAINRCTIWDVLDDDSSDRPYSSEIGVHYNPAGEKESDTTNIGIKAKPDCPESSELEVTMEQPIEQTHPAKDPFEQRCYKCCCRSISSSFGHSQHSKAGSSSIGKI